MRKLTPLITNIMYEEEMAYQYKEKHGVFPTYPVSDNKPVVYPVGWKILKVDTFQDKNGNDYKRVHCENENGKQFTALAFNSFSEYKKIINDGYCLGYIYDSKGKCKFIDRPTVHKSKLPEGDNYYSYND